MAKRRTSHYQPPRCAHCDKDARDYHYHVAAVPEGTDPTFVHHVYDPMVIPVIVYHYCGHYTIYRREPEQSGS